MEACLDLMFHGVLLTIIFRQRTKDIVKFEKYSQKNVRIVYNT